MTPAGPKLLIVTQAVDRTDQVLGFFHAWIEEFAKHCESVTVICLREGVHELPPNVRVFSLGKEKGEVSSSRYAWRFLRLIWRERHAYDQVFVHMNTEYVLLGGFFWRLLGKYVALWYAHGSVTMRLRGAVALAHKVVTSSLLGMRIQTKKVVVVGQGIDTAQFAPGNKSAHAALQLITVGRISKRKHLEGLLPVLDLFATKGIPFEYTIVGASATPEDVVYESELKEQIGKRPYAQAITFLGPLVHDQLPEVLSRMDVFVNLSQTGSLDKAVLEAIAAEVPTVSANLAFKGLLLPYGMYIDRNDPQEIGDMILRAKDVPVTKLREEIVREHSLEALVPKILTVYPQ